MILSGRTLAILQNFQTINPSILIRPGSQLRTLAGGVGGAGSDSMFATADIEEVFPQQFAIYDLSKFLALLSIDKQSLLKFYDAHLVIQQGESRTKFTYANPVLIVSAPDKNLVMPPTFITLELKSYVLQTVFKAMSILGFNEIAFTGKGGDLTISAVDTKNPDSDVYSTVIGQTSKTFSVIIDAAKLKLVNANYTVSLSDQGLAYFKAEYDRKDVQYWIALSTKSVFG